MVITKLVPQKRGSRFNIFIDDKFAFGVSAFIATKHKLSENTQVSVQDILSIYKEEQVEYLKQKALDYLSARPRSEKEVKDKLKSRLSVSKFALNYSGEASIKDQKAVRYEKINKSIFSTNSHFEIDSESTSIEIIEEVINFLKKYDYLNDITFANWLCEQRLNQGKGERFIKQDLFKKGVGKKLIEQVIKKLDTKSSLDASYKKALKKYSKESDKYKKKQKIYRYLLSRGFSYGEVNNLFD